MYLTDVDRMLGRAKEATRNGKYTYIEYAREHKHRPKPARQSPTLPTVAVAWPKILRI
jgi:hypothetical protein